MFSDCDHVWWYHTECDLLRRNATTLTPAEQRAFAVMANIWHDDYNDKICIGCERSDWTYYVRDVISISYYLDIVLCSECHAKVYSAKLNTTIYEAEHREHRADHGSVVMKCVLRIGNVIAREEHDNIIFGIFATRDIGFIDDIVRYIANIALAIYLGTSVV